MQSMDDTFERMKAFEHALSQFADALNQSMNEMAARHADVDPVWESDEVRRSYDAQYVPLRAMLERFCRVSGPEYLDFLQQKLRAIESYLYGHR